MIKSDPPEDDIHFIWGDSTKYKDLRKKLLYKDQMTSDLKFQVVLFSKLIMQAYVYQIRPWNITDNIQDATAFTTFIKDSL